MTPAPHSNPHPGSHPALAFDHSEACLRRVELPQTREAGPALAALIPIIAPILHEHGVIWAAAYGSFARGDQTEASDLDLLYFFDHPADLFALMDLEDALAAAVGRTVDLASLKWLKPEFRKHIADDIVRIL